MARLFIRIYTWLTASGQRYWLALSAVVVALAVLSLRVRLTSDVSDFFPEASAEADYVMHHVKAANKTTIVFTPSDTLSPDAPADLDMLIAAAESCRDRICVSLGETVVVSLEQSDDYVEEAIGYVYANLPFLLTEEDYAEIGSRLMSDSIEARMAQNKKLIASMAGQSLSPVLTQDPLLLAAGPLSRLAALGEGSALTAADGYLVSQDGSRLVMFVDIAPDISETTEQETVAKAIDEAVSLTEKEHPVTIYSYGAPQVSASNARRVSADIWLTMSISLSVLVAVMLMLFRSAKSVMLLVVPVGFGVLFAFGLLGAFGCRLSQLAVAAGAMVMGISLSYSIHIVTHGLHVDSPRRLLSDMAWPMTVGSLTTIGAFAALLFTSSTVLRDLGLFASLVMIGSLLFSLVFLPKLMSFREGKAAGQVMSALDRFSTRDWSKSWLAVIALCALFAVCLFNFSKVGFNSDLAALNYVGHGRLSESLPIIEETLGVDGHKTSVVVTGGSVDDLATNALRLSTDADRLKEHGLNRLQSIAPSLLVSTAEQRKRLALWQSLWGDGAAQRTLAAVSQAAKREGFRDGVFAPFAELLSREWQPTQPDMATMQTSPLFKDWISPGDSILMLYVNVEMDIESRDALLDSLAAVPHVVQTDMGYYARKSASVMVDDFNWLLLVSSAIVGLALLLSYGRVELFAMTFLPMMISWVIILGLMTIFKVEFNVINIILSTFVFGVGDDYSIFIMDGLLSERSSRRETLTSHKTAITLSAFAAMAGLGAQAFGQHPAVRSMGLLSVFGLIAVVVTSFIVQPLLFRIFISGPARKGHPYTALSLLRTLVTYGGFALTCVLCHAAWLLMTVLIPRKSLRQDMLHKLVYYGMRVYTSLIRPIGEIKKVAGLDLSKPSVIVANHQSVVDILSFLATSPRLVFVVKSWVSKTPVMGSVVKALGFYDIEDENGRPLIGEVSQLVNRGYSVVVFPEGGRSADSTIHRFHKGAFLLAKELGLRVTPVVFYGNGYVVSKSQPFNIMKGLMEVDVLPQLNPDDFSGETAVKDMAREAQRLVKERYAQMCLEYDSKNPYFAEAQRMDNLYKI